MQHIVLNDKTFQWGTVSSGVPQEFILGPLSFFDCKSDLTIYLKYNVELLADNMSLFQVFTTQINVLQF